MQIVLSGKIPPEKNQTRIEYWRKKCNDNEEEALKLYKNRQSTFSLKKCIEKYGEEEGLIKFNARQEKWMKNFKKQNFSKISQELFLTLYNKLKNSYDKIFFASLEPKTKEIIENKNFEYMLKLKKSYVKLDFYIEELNRCIEFDGTYWHGKKRGNQNRDRIREEKIMEAYPNMKILHITEKEYKENEDKTVKRCLDFFLNK